MPFQTRKQRLIALLNHARPRNDHDVPTIDLRLLHPEAFPDNPLDAVSYYSPPRNA
jgi:hypothetical protein